MKQLPLSFYERVVFQLRGLYSQYGYSQYKMSKFEEYDFYARNKDFLISDSVITFTDTNGKLMALKPDVTLSIVKNSKDASQAVRKLYYDENVYRVAKSTHSFKEIMQVGLECLGSIDDHCICEVLTLAAESLRAISPDSILDISHLGLLSDLIDTLGIPADQKDALLKCIGEKNVHELSALCHGSGVEEENIQLLRQLVQSAGAPDGVLPKLKQLLAGVTDTAPLEQLTRVMDAMDPDVKQMLRIDFSAVDDIHYYNGIVFKGFIQGIAGSVLSGGQYDKLMQKLRRSDRAIGFAIYMDMLEQLEPRKRDYDVDAVLLYDADTPLTQVQAQARMLRQQGLRVMAQQELPENIRYQQLLKMCDGEVQTLEYHA